MKIKSLKDIFLDIFLPLVFGILIFLWLGFSVDVAQLEPFSSFSITAASYFTLGLAGLVLVISVFLPRAWCKYFCPTGYLLDWIRK